MKIKFLLSLCLIALMLTACSPAEDAQTIKNQQNQATNNSTNDNIGGDFIIYKKNSGWGPCSENDKPCSEVRTLWTSGRLTVSGQRNAEFNLTPEQVTEVAAAIESSGVLKKDCSTTEMVFDYGATYYISSGSLEKEIEYPGCSEETGAIETLINSFIDDESLPTVRGGA